MKKSYLDQRTNILSRTPLWVVTALLFVLSVGCFPERPGSARMLLAIAQVKKIASQNEAQRFVHFAGVVTLVEPAFDFAVIQDKTGGIRVQPLFHMGVEMAGHSVDVTGQIAFESDPNRIVSARVTDLGRSVYPSPQPLATTPSKLESLDGQLVSVSGVPRDTEVNVLGRRSMLLALNQQGIGDGLGRVTFMSDGVSRDAQLLDAEVQLNAVLSATMDVAGRVTGFRLTAQDASSLHIVKAPADPSLLKTVRVAELKKDPGTAHAHRVRLRGHVSRDSRSTTVEFEDETGRIPLVNASKIDADNHGAMDLAGFISTRDGHVVLEYPIALNTTSYEDSNSRSGLLTSAAAIRALAPRIAGLERPVRLEGVVTYWDQRRLGCFIEDKSAGIYVDLHGSEPNLPVRAGDHVVVLGYTAPGDFAPIVQKPHFEVLGKAAMPPPSSLNPEEIFLGRADSSVVQLQGVIQSPSHDGGRYRTTVAWGSHQFQIQTPSGVQIPPDWVDRTVRVTGPAGTLFNARRQLVGIQILVPSLEFVKPLSPPKVGPSGLVISPIAKLLQFNPDAESGHRVEVRGTVISAHLQGPTWIQDQTGGVQILDHNPIELEPGDIVDVAAFASPGAFSPVLHDAEIKKISKGPLPHPSRATAEELLTGYKDSELVEIDGRLVNQYVVDTEQFLLMRAGKAAFTVLMPESSTHFENGSVLRVRGICSLRSKRVFALVVPSALDIIVGSPHDLFLLKPAPWLTQDRLLRIFGATALGGAIVLGWVFVLRRRVQIQTSVIRQKLSEVESLKEAAEKANRIKSEFLANMSHEIRTPMNGILGMTQLTLESELGEEQRENLSTVQASAESLLTIINDILDFSKIEAGKLELDPIEFDIRNNLEESVRALALRAHEKGLELICNCARDIPATLIGDPTRLRQITTNLVSNAIKFTQEGEVCVDICVEDRQGDEVTLHFIVSDTGIGIPPEKQESIFAAFVQADTSTTRKFGGTGLGLTISMRFVQMMRGKLWLTSSVGAGSRFHFTAVFGVSKNVARQLPRPNDLCLVGTSVLIVDDNLKSRRTLAETVDFWGMAPALAAGGEQALKLLLSAARAGNPFRLLLVDGSMPGMDGFELSERVAAEPLLGDLKVILLASGGQRGDNSRCRELGISGYLTKPVRQSELHSAVTTILEAPAEAPSSRLVTRHSLRDDRLRRGSILVAEDNPVNQKLIKRLIERQGYSTQIVSNGFEAVKAVEEQEFDLIFMDVQMPGMDGFEATASIRRLDRTTGKRNYIIAMTAHAMHGDRERCMGAGMDDYLSKPIDIKKLNEMLERMIATQ